MSISHGTTSKRAGVEVTISDVPRIEFLASVAGIHKSIEVPDGGPLVDICDHYFAPVPFSCRSATCATCHIEVVEGCDLLEPPSSEETALLAVIRAPHRTRLACQAVVKAGDGLIRLRPVLG